MRMKFTSLWCGNTLIHPAAKCLLVLGALWLSSFASCHGVSSDKELPERAVTNTNAFRSLRLGQTTSPTSPVATTAAANNGEAIVVLNRTPGTNLVEHVLYMSPQTEVARVTFADGVLPSSAEAAGVKLFFGKFAVGTVEIQIVPQAGSSFTLNVPLDTISMKLIDQLLNSKAAPSRLAREAESPEVLRVLYTKAIVGIRLFGCGSQSVLASNGISLPPSFTQIAQSACSSLLVDLLRAFIAAGQFTPNTIPGLTEEGACDFTDPNWINDFTKAEQCANAIGGDLIDEIDRIFPDVETAVEGTPTPTPTPQSTPKPDNSNDDDNQSSLHCDKGKFRCANGDRTCNEFACNGHHDCSDGSDEDSNLCTAEVLCCINANGCPGEAGGTCTQACCCCPSGQKCSKSPYLHGCVDD